MLYLNIQILLFAYCHVFNLQMQLRLCYYLFYYLPKIYSILSYCAHFDVTSLLAAQFIYSSYLRCL